METLVDLPDVLLYKVSLYRSLPDLCNWGKTCKQILNIVWTKNIEWFRKAGAMILDDIQIGHTQADQQALIQSLQRDPVSTFKLLRPIMRLACSADKLIAGRVVEPDVLQPMAQPTAPDTAAGDSQNSSQDEQREVDSQEVIAWQEWAKTRPGAAYPGQGKQLSSIRVHWGRNIWKGPDGRYRVQVVAQGSSVICWHGSKPDVRTLALDYVHKEEGRDHEFCKKLQGVHDALAAQGQLVTPTGQRLAYQGTVGRGDCRSCPCCGDLPVYAFVQADIETGPFNSFNVLLDTTGEVPDCDMEDEVPFEGVTLTVHIQVQLPAAPCASARTMPKSFQRMLTPTPGFKLYLRLIDMSHHCNS